MTNHQATVDRLAAAVEADKMTVEEAAAELHAYAQANGWRITLAGARSMVDGSPEGPH